MFCRIRFGSYLYPEMSGIPIHVQMKLDLTGIKISLKDWSAVRIVERVLLSETQPDTLRERGCFVDTVDYMIQRITFPNKDSNIFYEALREFHQR